MDKVNNVIDKQPSSYLGKVPHRLQFSNFPVKKVCHGTLEHKAVQ